MPYKELNLDSQLCFRLYTVSRLVVQCYRPFLNRLHITYPQYLVMMMLWEKDSVSVSDISKRLVLESNTVTPLLQRMEKDELIRRTKGKKDTRQTIISLTKKGKDLEEQAKEVPQCVAKYLTDKDISSKDMLFLMPILDNMIGLLKNK